MQGKICFSSIDVEHPIDSLGQIMGVFKKYNISPTLFVTGDILQQNADLFRELGRNYEIACHGFTHRFWDTLNGKERESELDSFITLYMKIFGKMPIGFRAPSHIIDKDGLRLLGERGFLYDSSIVPHYPPFKKYRGYKGRAPLLPYYPEGRKILEIPVRGQVFGIPLAGAWIGKLPAPFYKILFFFYRPEFITLNIHSWDSLKNFEKIIRILKNKRYQFLNGEQIYQNYR